VSKRNLPCAEPAVPVLDIGGSGVKVDVPLSDAYENIFQFVEEVQFDLPVVLARIKSHRRQDGLGVDLLLLVGRQAVAQKLDAAAFVVQVPSKRGLT